MPHPKVQFVVDLESLFGPDARLNGAVAESIGQAIMDRIVERTTKDNIDKNGRSLGRYSKSYAESLFGQVYGKRKGGAVTLEASGDMLGSMNIVENSGDSITIGFDDERQNTKAYGHVSGMQGHPFLDGKVQKRDFMGLPKGELKAIAAEFDQDVQQITKIAKAQTREEFEIAVTDAIASIEATLEPVGDGG